MGDPIVELLREREAQCTVQHRAYEMWLQLLTPLRWFAIGGGTLLPLVAGAKVLGTSALLGPRYELVSGLCALAASAITGLHSAFKCEDHQSECRHMMQEYSSLQTAYQGARALAGPQRQEKLQELEPRFDKAQRAEVAAPGRFRRRAEEELRRRATS